jgi:CheY-like chemotaxis protein
VIPQRPRILVVDDEPTVRTVTRLMLEGAGFSVTEVGTGTAALTRLRTDSKGFAVILLDVTLPDRSGPELVPDLRMTVPQSRIVLTSGKPEEDVPNHGADGYLPKPFSREQLLTIVRTAVAMSPT